MRPAKLLLALPPAFRGACRRGAGNLPGRARARRGRQPVAVLLRRRLPPGARRARRPPGSRPCRRRRPAVRVAASTQAPRPVRGRRGARAAALDAASRRPGRRRVGGAPQAGIRVLMRRACQLAALALLAALAGCERASAFKPGTQLVLAKVNGVEISARDSSGDPGARKDHRPRAAGAEGARRGPRARSRRWRSDRQRAPPGAGAGLSRPRRGGACRAARPKKCAPSTPRTRRSSPSGASTGCASWRCRRPPSWSRCCARKRRAPRPGRGRGLAAGARRALHHRAA